jgi:AcrR family transcriptional regulator
LSRSTGWQAEKSAATRLAAIEGAIECFLALGYARSSTVEIARVARLSRGAMIHHFPTKRALLDATVRYIVSERVKAMAHDMSKLNLVGDRAVTRGIDVYWRHLHTRLFTAWHELVVASRTDPELARVMRAGTAQFEREWHRAVKEMFPDWAEKGALFELAMDLVQFLLEGMALNRLSHDARRRRERIREYLKIRIEDIFDAGTVSPRDRAVRHLVRPPRQAAVRGRSRRRVS